jgi:hypothetical protein
MRNVILSLEMDLERVGGAGNLLCFVDWRDACVFLIDEDGRFVRDVLNFRLRFKVPVLVRLWIRSDSSCSFEVRFKQGLLQGELNDESFEVVKGLIESALKDWNKEVERIRRYIFKSARFDEARRCLVERILNRCVE